MHMLKAASQENGKALNGLDFPRSSPSEFPMTFATDYVMWDQVTGQPWCGDAYPMTAMWWGLGATAGAFHRVHQDCEGVARAAGLKAALKSGWWAFPSLERLSIAWLTLTSSTTSMTQNKPTPIWWIGLLWS